MVFVPCQYTAQIEVRCSWYGEQVENTLYFKNVADFGETALNLLCNKIGDWWYTNLKEQQSTSVIMREVYGRNLTTEDGITVTNTEHAGVAGTQSGGSDMPANVAFVVCFRTGLAGRSRRGRNYFYGIRSNRVSGNAVTSDYRNAIIDCYELLLPGGILSGTNWTWVVCSRRTVHQWRTAGLLTPITAVIAVNDYIDSRRSRLPG